MSMRNRLIGLAVLAAMTGAASGAALAQTCPAGYALQPNGMCAAAPGGVVGGAANAAGNIVGGAVGAAGAIAGGAINTAGNIVGGTVGALTGQPPAPPPPPVAVSGSSAPTGKGTAVCPQGQMVYLDYCFPARETGASLGW
jgi:hypothetical protein